MTNLRFAVFKIVLLVTCAAACHPSTAQRRAQGNAGAQKPAAQPAAAPSPVTLARLEDPAIVESSGIVASRRNPGLFWTHNDSGDVARVFIFDRRGKSRGTFSVTGARARDWEDIAIGPGPAAGQTYLYAADIGDNNEVRDQVVVYRFPEPEVKADAPAAALSTAPAEAIRIKYPDGAHNAEALLVHPTTGDLYIVTKNLTGKAGVYKLAAPFTAEGVNTPARVATLGGPDNYGVLFTGGDISLDGRRVALCNYETAYELTLPPGAKGFDEIWSQPPALVPVGQRGGIGEAIGYRLDGDALLATSEGEHTPLTEIVIRPEKKP